ncbi:MAG: hypothetical protein PF569_00420 [Candidatus Woesearchaeota archaeon]|jgi:hypothetical protein|nr:hypothetical protein [Candidatus Woesearchaeota archaeon]
MNKKDQFQNGSKRIKISDLNEYIKQNNNWIPTGETNKNIQNLIEKYSKNNNLNILLDEDNQEFLNGYLNSNELISGKRITILPDGKKLARGGFSIFAKNLKFNNNKKYEWDISYENISGTKTYLYSEEKIEHEKKKKASIVNSFIREYPTIIEKLEFDLKKKKTIEHIALYTLIKTYIRVGNIEYYNNLSHKGLTTLQKEDITIHNNRVEFKFIGKDGIEQDIIKEFPSFYTKQLKELLDKKKKNDFIFTDKNGTPIHSQAFSKILFKYTGKHFYPHIIRSYYADSQCRKFIRNHTAPIPKKKVLDKFKEIGLNLGHKKFNKTKNNWETDYKVTIDNYIRPEYVEKMKNLIQKE